MAVDALARALAAGKVPVSAYEMAVKAGYTGTEEQFAEDMGNSGTNATNAAAAASAAAASAESIADSEKQIAQNKADIANITGNSAIEMTDGYYINLSGTTADVTTPSPQGSTPTRYAVVACSPGDKFTISARGGVSPRVYGFVAADGTVLVKSGASVTVTNTLVTAPADAAWLVVNDLSFTMTSYMGELVSSELSRAFKQMRTLTLDDDLNDLREIGIYNYSVRSIPSNAPGFAYGGMVVVYTLNNVTAQVYYGRESSLAGSSLYARRTYTVATGWSEWAMQVGGSLAVQRNITNTEDLNNITDIGIYSCSGASMPQNAPSTAGGTLVVFNMRNVITQEYFTTTEIWHRVRGASTTSVWGAWVCDSRNSTISALPILELTGDTTNMSKEESVNMNYGIFGQSGTCTVKWQGSSSLRYPKKNYTINKMSTGIDGLNEWAKWVNTYRAQQRFLSPLTVTDYTWKNPQTKFCTKANYVDPSMAKNIVSARLWGQMVASRVGVPGGIATTDGRVGAPNYGAVDGFPIEIKINGISQGLYTFNIPKDKWAFNMSGGTTEFVVGGENNFNNACMWKATMGVTDWNALGEYDETSEYAVGDYVIYDDTLCVCKTAIGAGGEAWNESHWNLIFAAEVAPTLSGDTGELDGMKAALQSLDTAISQSLSAGADWETTLAPYLDIGSVIDYFIFTCCINNHDALARNILYGTYNGTQWFMSAYDMDTTFGTDAYGTSWYPVVNDRNQFAEAASMNRLAWLMVNYSKDRLKSRYQELRSGILSEANVWNEFSNFLVYIPSRDFDIDRDIWQNAPGTATANMEQFMNYYRMHCAYLDSEIAAM